MGSLEERTVTFILQVLISLFGLFSLSQAAPSPCPNIAACSHLSIGGQTAFNTGSFHAHAPAAAAPAFASAPAFSHSVSPAFAAAPAIAAAPTFQARQPILSAQPTFQGRPHIAAQPLRPFTAFQG